MEGRRLQKSAPKRNPLYLIFIGLCIAVLALAVLSAFLSLKLSAVNRELKLAQSKLEQYESGEVLHNDTQEDGEPDDGRVPGDDVEAKDPSAAVPDAEPDANANTNTNTNTAAETGQKIGWLDLTGHREVQVAPKSVFDKYYTYYTTNGVNLRGGPGTGYDRVALLDLGTEVKGAAKEGGWTFVSVNGKFGWVSSDYLSATKPEPAKETKTPTRQESDSSEETKRPESTAESTPPVQTEKHQEVPGWLLS